MWSQGRFSEKSERVGAGGHGRGGREMRVSLHALLRRRDGYGGGLGRDERAWRREAETALVSNFAKCVERLQTESNRGYSNLNRIERFLSN